jgi:hypothetical protein
MLLFYDGNSAAAAGNHDLPGIRKRADRFDLGVFFVVLNFICLSFIQIHACFYINYIIYYGLLIFCCQNVATHLL